MEWLRAALRRYTMQGLLYTGDVLVSQKRKFQKIILENYRKEGRVLPWRKTKTPYHILVSEIMLQQTHVDRVIPKYTAFISAFPTLKALAAAPQIDVLRLWQGLGYNRRALALKRIAEEVVSKYRGHLPKSIELLEELPGIGPYTARAVGVFAWNDRHSLIETNIRNVYTFFFFESMGQVEDREILALVEKTLPQENSREWYYALMDYGAKLKKSHRYLNARSRHYTKQSKFNGSDRQIRGKIIKLLLGGQKTLWSIVQQLEFPQARIEENIAKMMTEGFIEKTGRLLHVAKNEKIDKKYKIL